MTIAHPPVMLVAAPAAFGGAETVLASLATGLRDAGSPVTVALVVEGAPPPALMDRLDRVAVEMVRTTARGYRDEARAVMQLARHHGAALVHTHGYRPDLVVGTAAVHAGLRWVSTAHGFTSETWRLRLYEALQRRRWRAAEAVIAVSRPLAERIVGAGVPAARVHTLANALPTGILPSRGEARQALGLSSEDRRPIALWIGRLSVEKGADLALDAWAALAADHRPRLLVIGDGPERSALELQAAALGLGADVQFCGAVPQAHRLLPAADLLVLSSRTEGTPMVLLEAMQAGVPIVAAAVGGVPDLLAGGAGRLVAAVSPEAMAAAVAELVAEPAAAAALGAAGRARVAADYAHGAWIARHQALYAAAPVL